ncbi:hypothetical protein NAL19_1379 [Pectobacterium sp. F1-1]|nr:hypothetical protein NAL19_1379 [Pectobacterium sp. F1-1]
MAQSERTGMYLQRLYDLSVTTAIRTLSATSNARPAGIFFFIRSQHESL